MKFDTFLATVNDWGKFQKIKYCLICLTYTLPAIMVYTYTFSAATPNFRCQHPQFSEKDQYTNINNEDFRARYQPTKEQCSAQKRLISLKECQRCFMNEMAENKTDPNHQLLPCKAYTYDRQFYTKTLVEEVSCHCLHP